jgi:hypothetical protein
MRNMFHGLICLGCSFFASAGGSAIAAPGINPVVATDGSVLPAHYWGWGYGRGRGYYGGSYGRGYYGRSYSRGYYGHGYYGRSYGRGYYGRRY